MTLSDSSDGVCCGVVLKRYADVMRVVVFRVEWGWGGGGGEVVGVGAAIISGVCTANLDEQTSAHALQDAVLLYTALMEGTWTELTNSCPSLRSRHTGVEFPKTAMRYITRIHVSFTG